MARAPQSGDVLIRHSICEFELVDPVTDETIARRTTLVDAVRLAANRGGAVWRQNIDAAGRGLGEPILLLPRRT
jgi:hypothetical protein